MKIYQLIEDNTKERICKASRNFGLPGIDCSQSTNGCGEIWANTLARIHAEVPQDGSLFPISRRPVSPDEFARIEKRVVLALGLPASTHLMPGTDIGYANIMCEQESVSDFEWPFTHTTIVKINVINFLVNNNLTGWVCEKLNIMSVDSNNLSSDLSEFVITGKGGELLTKPVIDIADQCRVCKRITYNIPTIIEEAQINQYRWDGSDFFRFVPPFEGYIFVTERAKEILSDSGFDGFDFRSLDQWIDRHNSRFLL